MPAPAIGRLRLWVGVAAMTLGLALAARDLIPALYKPAPPQPVRPALQSADPGIRLTERDGAALVVYADVTQAPDVAGNIDRAGDILKGVGQALQRGVSDDLKGVSTVRVVFRCQAINRFGQDVMAQLVTLELPLAKLKAADYDRARPADVLGLTDTLAMGAPGSYDAVSAWCADPARRNAAFCAKAPMA